MAKVSWLRRTVIVVLVAFLALGLAGCKSEAEGAREAVAALLESYVVPVPDEEGNLPEDPAWPASDFGDAATMGVLETYGVNADEWHERCFAGFGYEVGEAAVEGDTARVSVTVTNASLSAAVSGAGEDFASFAQGSDAQEAYRQGGKPALFSQLVSYVYARLEANESPVVTTLDVTCAKAEDGSWVPQVSGNAAFFSALYGGSNVIDGLVSTVE